MTTLLESQQLCKSFVLGNDNEYTVLSDVDLTIESGEFVAVMGPSGSGKSTLLYNISGMDRAKSGRVLFNGQDITALSEEELAKVRLTGMGFVFQHIHLLKNLSIFDNVVLSAYLAREESHDEIDRRAEALMEQVGIAQLADNDITQASGGQLQRVGICRALINNPDRFWTLLKPLHSQAEAFARYMAPRHWEDVLQESLLKALQALDSLNDVLVRMRDHQDKKRSKLRRLAVSRSEPRPGAARRRAPDLPFVVPSPRRRDAEPPREACSEA